MKIDKTYSELWYLANSNEDVEVRQTANMAIKTLQKMQVELDLICPNESLKAEKLRLMEQISELVSLNLWSARRLKHQQYKDFAYEELEKITGLKHERV